MGQNWTSGKKEKNKNESYNLGKKMHGSMINQDGEQKWAVIHLKCLLVVYYVSTRVAKIN